MEAFRDVLDKQLLDQTGVKMGKVDGLVMTVVAGERPRITAIEVGSITLARRLSPRLARLTTRIAPPPYRIAWRKIVDIGVDIEVAVELKSTPLDRWREWLRRRVLKWIPGR